MLKLLLIQDLYIAEKVFKSSSELVFLKDFLNQ